MPANTIITVRKGSSSEWTSANPVLASGELGFDTTNKILKIGDGSAPWNSLSNHSHSASNITDFNSSVSGLVSGIYQPLLTNPVTGVGTSGYLTRWNGSNSVTSGIIFDNGSGIGIGTSTPSGKLHIGSGDLHFDSSYGLRWAGGSRLYEERVGVAGGSTERMLYLTNGDRFEVLSENGVEILMGVHGANSLLANSNRFRRAVGIGANYGSSGTLPFNGLAVQGNVGIGVQSPIAPLHIIGSGLYSTSDSSSIITIDPSSRSIDCNPSAFSDICLKANNQFIFRGLDGWTGTWADSAITTYFQVGRNAGNTIFTSLQGAPFTRLAYSANKIFFTNGTSNLPIPSGYFTIGSSIDGGSVGTSGLVIDTVHSSSSSNGQSHGALVVSPLFSTESSNLNTIYGAYIAPRHSGNYTTVNSYGLYVNAATNIGGTINNNYAAVFNGGNVGIGTTNPSGQLHVVGSGIFDSGIFIPNNVSIRTATAAGSQFNILRLDSADNVRLERPNSSSDMYIAASTAFILKGNDRVGMGHVSPLNRLAVNGATTIGSSNNVTAPANGLLVEGNVGMGTTTPSGQLHVVGTGIVSSRLGIGTNSPQYSLDVSGSGNFNNVLISGIPLSEVIDDEVAGLLVAGTGINLTYDDNNNQLILSSENYYGANRGIIEVSAPASSFNIPGGYTVGGFDLFLNGVKLVNDIDFTATNGNSINTASPIPSGSVLEYISLTLANPLRIASDQYSAEISREVISVTGTLSTINIIGGYDSGGLDVYKDGLKLIKDIQYSANNGSSISLTTPATSGSVIEYVSFLAGKARRSINTITNSTTAGTIPQTDYIYVATVPNITVTMPSAVGNNNRYTIKNLSNGTINVAPTPGQTIDNQSIISILNQYISIDLVSNNQNWIII